MLQKLLAVRVGIALAVTVVLAACAPVYDDIADKMLIDTQKQADDGLVKLESLAATIRARAVVRTVEGKQDGRSRWLQGLIVRWGKNRAGVAQANKTARIAWIILAKGERYRPAA